MAWKYTFNPLKFFILYLMFMLGVNWFHEFGHLTVGTLGGGEGVVGSGFLVFWTDFSVDPTGFMGIIMPFAGGLFGAVWCVLMWWLVEGADAIETRIVAYSVGATQAAYGLVEGFLFHMQLYNYVGIFGFLAMLVAAVYSLYTSKKMWNVEDR